MPYTQGEKRQYVIRGLRLGELTQYSLYTVMLRGLYNTCTVDRTLLPRCDRQSSVARAKLYFVSRAYTFFHISFKNLVFVSWLYSRFRGFKHFHISGVVCYRIYTIITIHILHNFRITNQKHKETVSHIKHKHLQITT